jgi:hypothetical protein
MLWHSITISKCRYYFDGSYIHYAELGRSETVFRFSNHKHFRRKYWENLWYSTQYRNWFYALCIYGHSIINSVYKINQSFKYFDTQSLFHYILSMKYSEIIVKILIRYTKNFWYIAWVSLNKLFVSLYTVMSFLYFIFCNYNVYVGIQCTNIGICLNKVSFFLYIILSADIILTVGYIFIIQS